MEKDKDKDIGWKVYFSDNERYADIINGIGCGGQQLVKETDLSEDDSQAGKKARDLFRRTALGMNFAIIGIENQETIDYSLPLRNMNYDVGKWKKMPMTWWHCIRIRQSWCRQRITRERMER